MLNLCQPAISIFKLVMVGIVVAVIDCVYIQGRRHRSGIVTGLALSDEPTFHNVFRLTVKTEVGQKNKVTHH